MHHKDVSAAGGLAGRRRVGQVGVLGEERELQAQGVQAAHLALHVVEEVSGLLSEGVRTTGEKDGD